MVFFLKLGHFFAKPGHFYSTFKKGQGRPPPLSLPHQLRACYSIKCFKLDLRKNE